MSGAATIEATLCRDYNCEVPLSNGYTICAAHTDRLKRMLARVADVWANLRVTIGRQDATAASIGGGATGSRPCINLDAHDKGETLTAVLNGWAGMLDIRPGRTPGDTASTLAAQLDMIAREEWAGDLLDELREALHDCTRVTDRAADRISLGVCGFAKCEGTVVAIVGAHNGRCRECGVIWDAIERQQWMISEAWNATGSLRLLVNALRESKHFTVRYETVKKWAQRGKLYGHCDLETREHVYTAAGVFQSYLDTIPLVASMEAA